MSRSCSGSRRRQLGIAPQDGYGGRFVGLADIFNVAGARPGPGQPSHVGSVFGTYSCRREAGATLGTTAVSSATAGYINAVRLPGYTVRRASVYRQGRRDGA